MASDRIFGVLPMVSDSKLTKKRPAQAMGMLDTLVALEQEVGGMVSGWQV